jgi:hypothetical protein
MDDKCITPMDDKCTIFVLHAWMINGLLHLKINFTIFSHKLQQIINISHNYSFKYYFIKYYILKELYNLIMRTCKTKENKR